MNNYYYYCTKIRKMMKIAKAENRVEKVVSNDETILVKYCKEWNDFMIQYSWIMDNDDKKLDQEVLDFLGKYDPIMYHEEIITTSLDIKQIGLITVNTTCEEDIASVIEHFRSYPLQHAVDTNYIFCGKKLLRVLQYYGAVRHPLEYLNLIPEWNKPALQISVQDEVMTEITKGINYSYSEDSGKVVFTLGDKNDKTTFIENINETVPKFICIDTFLGIIVNELTDNCK